MNPLPLPVAGFAHFYRGGERLAELRGGPPIGPEEWLASTVARWGAAPLGETVIDGVSLGERIATDPTAWLGPDHVARWGTTPALLVKLLDAGERLPVHVHPTRRFAASHLGCPFGKTEAWVVVDAPEGGGDVFVGATRPVPTAEWKELVDRQATDAMLALLHRHRIRPGDGVLVPAGTPHAIGAGVFVVELQEPTDFSVLLEWDGFAVDGPADGMLGLPPDVAIGAVREDAIDADAVDALIRRAEHSSTSAVLPPAADPYFRANWLRPDTGAITLAASFAVVIVLDGAATLGTADGGRMPIARGDAVVVPHACGAITIDGAASVIVARSPDAAASDPVEWDAP